MRFYSQVAFWQIFLLSCTSLCTAASIPSPNNTTSCRCFPGDACWPSVKEWAAFNQTLGGKLVGNIPLASVCHDSSFGPYDAEKCDTLRSNWFAAETHLRSIGSIMAPFFTNDTCNLFLPRDAPCTLGNMVSFAVNATGVSDFQQTIAFARQHNIRLVIRNTGHDYNGKSNGAGGLAIWTYHMKDQEIVDFESPTYNGKAVKMSAGVSSIESYQFAHDHGFVSVGGDCPTVGVTGGWTQGGGGHGPGVSKFGLGANQALEWEVVTGTGEVLIANREQNQDMYWALTGGGGGTYGVVISLTAKIYPDLISSAATLSFNATGTDPDAYWDVIKTWQRHSLDVTGSGCFAIWSVTSEEFKIWPANCPGLSKNQTFNLFRPTLNKLADYRIHYDLNVTEFPNFLESYMEFNVKLPKNVSDSQFGGRIIPKELVLNNNTELTNVFRKVISLGASIGVTAVDISKHANETEYGSINPARRDGAFSALFLTDYDQTNYNNDIALAAFTTDVLMPMIEAITPNGSAYLNECNFQQPNFQEVLYGVNYPRLLQIKERYDPDQLFYALQAVGSDKWYEDQLKGGRLCRVGA